MFGPMRANGKTADLRHEQRKKMWKISSKKFKFKFPLLRYYFHWLFHNIPVHILIGLFPCKKTFDLHEASSDWLNAKHHGPLIDIIDDAWLE